MLTDFFAYISGDATLRSLINGASSDLPRIYPEIAPEGTEGYYLIYGPLKEGSLDEVMDQMTIQVSVFVPEHGQLAADAIIRRLKALLDLQDQIQGRITSSIYNIYWSKHIGGLSNFDEKTREYHRAAMFAFKFKLK